MELSLLMMSWVLYGFRLKWWAGCSCASLGLVKRGQCCKRCMSDWVEVLSQEQVLGVVFCYVQAS